MHSTVKVRLDAQEELARRLRAGRDGDNLPVEWTSATRLLPKHRPQVHVEPEPLTEEEQRGLKELLEEIDRREAATRPLPPPEEPLPCPGNLPPPLPADDAPLVPPPTFEGAGEAAPAESPGAPERPLRPGGVMS